MTIPSPTSIGDLPHVAPTGAAIGTVVYMPVLRPGRVKDFHVTVGAATTTAAETFQLAYAPPGSATYVNIAQALITQASGAVAGTNIRQQCAPSGDSYVQDGGSFRITPAGGAGGGAPITAVVVVGN